MQKLPIQNLNLESLGLVLFLLGIITCTWDLFLTFGIAGFTLKIHALFFFLSLILNLFSIGLKKGIQKILQLLRHRFILFFLILAGYYFVTIPWSYFPQKSFLYSCWIVFNAFTIWVNAGLWMQRIHREKFYFAVFIAVVIQSAIITVDHIAHGFGYVGGLIGHNQDGLLRWGLSRPSGFSSEPSYIATFISLSFILLSPWILKKKSIWVYAFSTLGVFALVSSTSRTGWLLLLIGMVLGVCLKSLQTKIIPWRGIFVGSLTLTILGIVYLSSLEEHQRKTLGENLVFSAFIGNEGSGFARLRAHKSAWIMAQDTNYRGTGLGASYWYWISNRERTELKGNTALTPDRYGKEVVMSIWGQLLAEAGFFGPIAYFLAIFYLLRSRWNLWKKSLEDEDLYLFLAAFSFFSFGAFWLGNIARGDVWIWYAIWTHAGLYNISNNTKKLTSPEPSHINRNNLV